MPDDFEIFLLKRDAAVKHKDNQIGALEGFFTFFDADFFDDIFCFTNSRCINQANRNAADRKRLLDGITGCARNLCHDRAGFSEQRVHQRRFTDIRFADDRDLHPFAQNFSCRGGSKQRVNSVFDFSKLRCEFLKGQLLDVLIRIIDIDRQLNQNIDKHASQRAYFI